MDRCGRFAADDFHVREAPRSAASPCGMAMLSERDLQLRTHHDSKGDKQTLRAGAADLRPTTPFAA